MLVVAGKLTYHPLPQIVAAVLERKEGGGRGRIPNTKRGDSTVGRGTGGVPFDNGNNLKETMDIIKSTAGNSGETP